MVSEPTVLIVGAGGSMPYGYPSGSDLVDQIILGLNGNGAPLFILLKRMQMNFTENDINGFRESLFESRRYSIDLFLERHDEYMEIGKAAIAGALLKYEQGMVRSRDPKLDWYRHLFDRLARNRDSNKKGRLTLIVYNYDRSIDHYLFQAFMNAYKLSLAETIAIFQELEIIHLHGSLCPLPWQKMGPSDIPRKYGEDSPGTSARHAADGIRIIHELDPGELGFTRAHAALAASKRIVILGFGYEPTNVRRLFGKELSQIQVSATIHGTGYNLTESEASDVKAMFGRRLHMAGPSEDCLLFLRNHTALLS